VSVHWMSRQSWTPGMQEYLVGEDLLALSRAVAGDRHYIRASELARLVHRHVYETYGANAYQPQWLISALSRQGIKARRHHGRPPVYDVSELR
jgi:hypothetical protein